MQREKKKENFLFHPPIMDRRGEAVVGSIRILSFDASLRDGRDFLNVEDEGRKLCELPYLM